MMLRYKVKENENIVFDSEGYSIPFYEVKRLIEFLPYASSHRIAIELLSLTGMRVSELEKIKLNCFYGEFVIWKTGKNQRGYRKEKLPFWFLHELDKYIQSYSFVDGFLFGFDSNTLSTYINKKIRPKIAGNWLKKRVKPRGSLKGLEYVYQLKSLRHNFATLEFARNLDKWGKDVAVIFTAKKMKHSTYKMTAEHYLENFDSLDIERYKEVSMSDLLKEANQRKITEFLS